MDSNPKLTQTDHIAQLENAALEDKLNPGASFEEFERILQGEEANKTAISDDEFDLDTILKSMEEDLLPVSPASNSPNFKTSDKQRHSRTREQRKKKLTAQRNLRRLKKLKEDIKRADKNTPFVDMKYGDDKKTRRFIFMPEGYKQWNMDYFTKLVEDWRLADEKRSELHKLYRWATGRPTKYTNYLDRDEAIAVIVDPVRKNRYAVQPGDGLISPKTKKIYAILAQTGFFVAPNKLKEHIKSFREEQDLKTTPSNTSKQPERKDTETPKPKLNALNQ